MIIITGFQLSNASVVASSKFWQKSSKQSQWSASLAARLWWHYFQIAYPRVLINAYMARHLATFKNCAVQHVTQYSLPESSQVRQQMRIGSFRRHRLSTYGPRAFSIAGPQAWNSLPLRLRNADMVTSKVTFFQNVVQYLILLST